MGGIASNVATQALPHMEMVDGYWRERPPVDNPTLLVSLKLHRQTYTEMGMVLPPTKCSPLHTETVADSGAQMCIMPAKVATQMGLKLFQVSTKVIGATR